MNARIESGLAAALAEPPEFIKQREPVAIYGWFSTGRLVIMKDGDAISLSRDDLAGLRDFLNAFEADD